MIGRIDPVALARLARSDLPRPLDVLNLIQPADERSYARYGLAVSPAMFAVGARLRWMGNHARSLQGESQAQKLMVVRYPSHRRFLAMTVNPYYIAINRWRERGVESFEAAFTHPHSEPGDLRATRWLLVAHFNAPLTFERLRDIVEPQAGPLVYASQEVASASFLRDERPTDPNPLSYKKIACFAADEDVSVEQLPELEDVVLQLYRRGHPRKLLAQAR